MIALMMLATLWIPLVAYMFWKKAKNIVTNVYGYTSENTKQSLSTDISAESLRSLKEKELFDRIEIRINVQDEEYIYTGAPEELQWPPPHVSDELKLKDIDGLSWISKAELLCTSHDNGVEHNTDVLREIERYAGPMGDFFNTKFDFGWIFPKQTDIEIYKSAELHLSDTNGFEYSIDLLTNEEINGLDDIMSNMCGVRLLTRGVHDFVVMTDYS